MSNPDLERLNRLRVNAGMSELKSWKASKATLLGKIDDLLAAGHSDALPGAKVDAAPTVDPILDTEIKTLTESALATMKAPAEKPDEPKEKPKAKLARGLDTDPYAAQSRLAVRMQREQENKDEKAARKAAKLAAKEQKRKDKKNKKKDKVVEEKPKKVKLSKADKKQIREEAESRKIVGKVDEKKDPEKAKRQIEKIDAKQKARKDKPAKQADEKNFTVAELARELDIDPKTARNKLRRHEAKIEKLHSKGQDRWTFPNAAKPELTKILKGEK